MLRAMGLTCLGPHPQVEPSPTTGIQHCIPPLFHSTTATRSAFANVANKNAASAVTEAPIRQVPQEALSSPLVSLDINRITRGQAWHWHDIVNCVDMPKLARAVAN